MTMVFERQHSALPRVGNSWYVTNAVITSSQRIAMITGMKNIVVFVTDLARAKRFYVELLKLPLAQESMTMMELSPPGGTALGVALALTDEARNFVGRHTGITLTVQGIEQFCRDLTAAGVAFAEPLEVSPWGKMAVVKDPDGNQLALVEM